MLRRRTLPPSPAVLLLALCGCRSAPTPPPDAEQQLAQAEALVTARDWQAGLNLLAGLDGTACPKRLRDRRDLATASARMGLGEYWGAFELLETFPDLYPHSELRPSVVEAVWQIGSHLANSDAGFLFFWSDRRAGRTVLEHLITRHPDTPRLADALRVLGDMAFADDEHELAQERFRDLLRRRPESEWVIYARFRFAMSIVASLQGPDYDLDRMQHAVRELRDFLVPQPEAPAFVQQAEAAVARLLEWQAERHLSIAAFYGRVGNVSGQRRHLDIAASEEFANTPSHARAVAKRDALLQTLAESAPAAASR
ncbi:MAG: outer membrane protein assembly factor BamD [Planctomycetota bacterium]